MDYDDVLYVPSEKSVDNTVVDFPGYKGLNRA